MRVYALLLASACDWPMAGAELFRDRSKAVDAWRREALDQSGYPGDGPEPDDLTAIGQMADHYLEDMEAEDLEWVIGNDLGSQRIDEMTTVILTTLELEDL